MPRRYNLRQRDKNVKWVEDETLKEKEEESESEDEDYEPPSEDESEEEEEDESEDEELDDEESEDESEEEEVTKNITIPLPKNGRIKIEIDNRRGNELYEDSEDESEEEEDGFLGYLMDKYAPRGNSLRMKKPPSNKRKDDKESEEAPLMLNDEEQDYYDDLSRSKRKKLNKHMKQIQALVAEGDVPRKFRILELPIPDPIKASVIKKLDMLGQMEEEGGGDTHKLRSWIDGFMRIPFGQIVPLPVKLDDGPVPCAKFLGDTRESLDKAVYGMQTAKTQVMQILAQWIANPGSIGNVIALKGPMGVGKTSFAKNGVANVLKRPFEFFSLGGATDSANFVGHSYTYEGSMWGRVVDSLINARSMNPVMYFDELDKISDTAQGQEIVSMLIHLTDRSQNTQFHDRYFAGVDIDLSQCLFVFSFNDENKVHPILKDRMQVIHCSGYSADDKFQIVEKYIWPQMLERTNFKDLTIKSEAIKLMIREYSSEEEGVRTLIRALETLTTRINLLRIADETTAKTYKFYTKIELPCCIDTDMVQHILQDLGQTHNESWKRLYT